MSKKIKNIYFIIIGIIILGLASIVIYQKYFSKNEREKVISELNEKYFYLNHYKDVEYVGNEKCISCHTEIHSDYHQTGMGKSLYKPSADNDIEDFEKENIIYDAKSDYYYQAYKQGSDYYQKEFRKDKEGNIIHELIKKADYVIGSGNNTRSYLYNENGFFYEMPLSWYSEKKKWDISPGYQKFNLRFSRPIVQECMNCHNGYAGFTEFSENKFHTPLPEGISCERCHGPGELHVKRQSEENDLFENIEKDTIDRTIVNPADLPLEEKLSVCFQCHLQGDVRVFTDGKKQTDFRPGMILGDVKAVFVQDNIEKGDFKIASHAARMFLSDCFEKSKGQMTCITCHDPHKPVQTISREFFNNKCIDCHSISSLSPATTEADHKPTGDCVSCHMRQGVTKDVLHVNFTDHWIRKEIKVLSEDENEELQIHIIPVTLKNFNNPSDRFSEMNLGIAYVTYYDTKHPHIEYLKRAIPLLENNLKKFPEHTNGLYWLGIAYLKENRNSDAIKTFEKLVSLDPGNSLAYYQLGAAYEKAKNNIKSIESYQKSLYIFPENVKALNNLGNIFYNSGKINEAVEAYRKAINVSLQNPVILNNLGDIHLYKLQLLDAAKNYFKQALALDPDFTAALNNLGNAYMLEGNTIEAEKIFKQVLEKDSKNVLAYGNLAVLYEDRKEISEAKKMLNKVLEIDPKDVRAKQMLEKLYK